MTPETDNLITVPLAAKVFGLTERAIRGKIADGHWRRGVEFVKGPDKRIYIDREKVRQWISGLRCR